MAIFVTKINENYSEYNLSNAVVVKERKSLCSLTNCHNLKELMKKERNEIPLFMYKVMSALYNSTDSYEGVFRVCSDTDTLNSLMENVGLIDLTLLDNIDLASMVKKFIRDLEEPIWPSSSTGNLITETESVMSKKKSDDEWKIEINVLIDQMPNENKNFLKYLLALFKKIANDESSNMDENNIAICLAFSVLVSKDDLFRIAKYGPVLIHALTLLQKYYTDFYPVCVTD